MNYIFDRNKYVYSKENVEAFMDESIMIMKTYSGYVLLVDYKK